MEELTENDYEILDACCELQSIKIKALKEENAVLQSYKDVNEDFKTAWEELKAENDKLNKILQEIKTIVKKNISYQDTDSTTRAMTKILDLITKAEEE